MHIPRLKEKVRLVAVEEIYVVTRVNYEAQVADLLPTLYKQKELRSVPFLAMEAIPELPSAKMKPARRGKKRASGPSKRRVYQS